MRSTSTVLYIGEKKGPFQHSSFFAGRAMVLHEVLLLRMVVLKAAWLWSMLVSGMGLSNSHGMRVGLGMTSIIKLSL